MVQGQSFLTQTSSVSGSPLVSIQTSASLPQSTSLETATNLLLPDVDLDTRLSNFPDQIYDLSSTSHLRKLLQAVLGDSGVGQLRKRYLLARLSNNLDTTHFLDLDRFYGALFGFQRMADEVLATDPYTEVVTQDEWDTIHSQDSSYRSRIAQFGQSIMMGGTPVGLAAAAQAVINAPCDIIETSYLISDAFGQDEQKVGYHTYGQLQTTYITYSAMQGDTSPQTTFTRTYQSVQDQLVTYQNMQALTYASIEAGIIPASSGHKLTYSDIEGGTSVLVERTTEDNRGEFLVVAHRAISLEEQYSITRTLNKLKPLNSLMTVELDGIQIAVETTIPNIAADSEDWGMDSVVTAPVSVVYSGRSPYLVDFSDQQLPAPPPPPPPPPPVIPPVIPPQSPWTCTLYTYQEFYTDNVANTYSHRGPTTIVASFTAASDQSQGLAVPIYESAVKYPSGRTASKTYDYTVCTYQGAPSNYIPPLPAPTSGVPLPTPRPVFSTPPKTVVVPAPKPVAVRTFVRIADYQMPTTNQYLNHDPGSDGVKWIQERLPPLVIDGYFGPLTDAAVRAFQKAHPPLAVDGIVGPLTRAQLQALPFVRGYYTFDGDSVDTSIILENSFNRIIYSNGTVTNFTADKALMPYNQVLRSLYTSQKAQVVHPYAGGRRGVLNQ